MPDIRNFNCGEFAIVRKYQEKRYPRTLTWANRVSAKINLGEYGLKYRERPHLTKIGNLQGIKQLECL
jgi:hypothetical protein